MKKMWVIISILFITLIIIPIFLNQAGLQEGLVVLDEVKNKNSNANVINKNLSKVYTDLSQNMFSDEDADQYFNDPATGTNMLYEILEQVKKNN
jgi:hypothetical protein